MRDVLRLAWFLVFFPKTPENGPKMALDGPQKTLKCSNMVMDGPKTAPDGPEIFQDCTKMVQNSYRITQKGHKSHQDGTSLCKMACELLKMIPSLPQDDSQWHCMCNCTNEKDHPGDFVIFTINGGSGISSFPLRLESKTESKTRF